MKPSLFGVNNSNKDLNNKNSWGKNQFNNIFPIALINYMYSKNIKPKYIKLNNKMKVSHTEITSKELFGLDYDDKKLQFNFEYPHTAFQRFSNGTIPRADVTTSILQEDIFDDKTLSSLEIKLTALPDHTTHNLEEHEYGSELVIRPDTIVYLAFSLISLWYTDTDKMYSYFENVDKKIKDFTDERLVKNNFNIIIDSLNNFLLASYENQKPLIIQPIWKTNGKSPKLADDCLDVFVWSDHAFTRLFIDESRITKGNLTRTNRSCVWLIAMLIEFSKKQKLDHKKIIDEITFNTKNDKAFALSGKKTYNYMRSEELTKPRIKVSEIQNIILGGGEKLLSPERRFDSALVSAPGLFREEDEN